MLTAHYGPNAVRGLYRLPRGIAGEVTEAIKQLLTNPTPPDCEPVQGRERTYRIHPAGHTVEYEIMKEQGQEYLVVLYVT